MKNIIRKLIFITAILSTAGFTIAAASPSVHKVMARNISAQATLNPPTNLVAQETANKKAVYLTWQASSGAAGYCIFRSRTQGTYSISDLVDSTNALNYLDDGQEKPFDAGAFYYYYVITACDAQGNQSDISNEVEAVPHFPIDWAGTMFSYYLTGYGDNIINSYQLGNPEPVSVFAEVFLHERSAELGIDPDIWAQFGYEVAGSSTNVNLEEWNNWVDAQPYGVGMNEEVNARFMYNFIPEKPLTYNFTFRFSTDLGRHWKYLYYDVMEPDPKQYPVSALGKIIVIDSDDNDPPTAPGLTIEDSEITETTIKMSWAAASNDDIYAYDIYRTTVDAATDADWVRINRTVHSIGLSSYSFTDSNLEANNSYYYKLVALDTSFNSDSSERVQATTLSSPISFSLNFTIPSFTPENEVISINLVSASTPDQLGQEIWNSDMAPGSCNFTTYQCTASLTLQENYTFRFRFSRGSQETIQTQLDGNTSAIDPSFQVTSAITTVNRIVANWDDPLVVAYTPSGDRISPTSAISITWNQDMPQATTFVVNDKGSTGSSGGTLIPGTFSDNSTSRNFFFNPTRPLKGDWYYEGVVQNAVDKKGVLQQVETTWTFSTGRYRSFLPVITH